MGCKQVDLFSRQWLNAPGHHGNGYIVTEVKSEEDWVTGEVIIADCNRSISLDFYIEGLNDEQSDAELRNDLAKIDLVISELQEFRKVFSTKAIQVKRVRSDPAVDNHSRGG